MGYQAFKAHTDGNDGVAIGSRSLMNNTTGSLNTGLGAWSLSNNTTGVRNTAIGSNTLQSNITGSNNTALGNLANVGSDGLTNATAIGYQASVSASNTIQLGNASVTDVITSGDVTAGGFKTPSGTSSQYLMADGSVSTSVSSIASGAVTTTEILDGTILKADISASAAIDQSKISGLSTSLAAKADLASPIFTGTPAAPTATAGTNTTQLATTAFVTGAVSTATSSLAVVREVADEFTATASQTSFTLTQAPSANSKVKMYVNGIRISNTAYSVSGSTLTYVPANNGSYALTAGDRIQMDYYY